jgi:nucleolar protein 53
LEFCSLLWRLSQVILTVFSGVIAELPSSALFTTDTTGDSKIQSSYHKKHKPLKADEILAQRSAIPALEGRKRRGDLTGTGILPVKKARKGFVSHKELERLRGVAYGGARGAQKLVKEGAAYDPWAEDEGLAPNEPGSAQLDFLEKKKAVRAPETMKHAPVALTASGKAPPAVRKPEAGKSYNPTFQDWDQVFTKAGEKEVAAEQHRLNAARAEEAREARALEVAAAVEEAERLREIEGSEWEESEWEGIQSEAEPATSKKDNKRKTKAEKNKVQRRKEAERKAVHEQKMRDQKKQAAQIEELAAERRRKKMQSKEIALKQDDEVDNLPADDEDDEDEDEEQEEVLRRKKYGKVP